MKKIITTTALLLEVTVGANAFAQEPSLPSAATEIAADAPMIIPSFELPPSAFLSPEGRVTLSLVAKYYKPLPPGLTAQQLRDAQDKAFEPILQSLKETYKVSITEKRIAGIRVREIVPADGVSAKNRRNVLINLHGGAYYQGAGNEALIESIPVAGETGMRVVTIDYRQAPEFTYPAATEDVLAVYGEILKSTKAKNIAIFGASAGGSLTSMVVAQIIHKNLPKPAAIGIFSSAAFADFSADPKVPGSWGGDSRYWAPAMIGQGPLPTKKEDQPKLPFAYLAGVKLDDPMVSPAESAELMKKFPPTLLLTGTRSYDLSAAVETHRRLIRNGAEAELHVWDGTWHCFFFDPAIPETREAYAVMGRFFKKHIGK